MTKRNHTIEEYEAVGHLFKEANDVLVKLIVKASTFGKTKYGIPLSKANAIIIEICSRLEERLFQEHPTEATTQMFYGKI